MTAADSASMIKKLGTILTIWAHPDDETFSAGGIMMAAARNGQKVICITATKGELGVQDPTRWPPEHLGDIRADELAAAFNIMGITRHHWLGYRDGSCQDVPTGEAVRKLVKFIDQYRPDTILTFGPDGMTGHPDHCAVSAWVDSAVKTAAAPPAVYHAAVTRENYQAGLAASTKYNFFFNTDKPPVLEAEQCDILFKLPDDLLIKKYKALLAMPSQYEAVFSEFGQDFICRMFSSEAFVRAK